MQRAKNLRRCLESARLIVDEIIVVDSVVLMKQGKLPGSFLPFGSIGTGRDMPPKKITAISRASYEWVLSLDADEAISQHLLSELLCWKTENIIPPEYGGFSMPRCTHYEGRWIRSGDWYPDRVVRLFRKDRSFYEGGKVHERLSTKGV